MTRPSKEARTEQDPRRSIVAVRGRRLMPTFTSNGQRRDGYALPVARYELECGHAVDPIGIVIICMAVVIAADGLWLVGVASADTAALLTGAAAVVGALAAVIEARRGSVSREVLADHEARLRVLEDRGSRSG